MRRYWHRAACALLVAGAGLACGNGSLLCVWAAPDQAAIRAGREFVSERGPAPQIPDKPGRSSPSPPTPLALRPDLPSDSRPPHRLPRHDPFRAFELMSEKLRLQVKDQAAGQESRFITDEIRALALGLDNDPLLIFNYVRNHILHEPTHGLLKNPRETLLSGLGSAMDQSALLVALLRAAGFQARYQYGLAILSFDQATSWTGAADPETAADFFANGGINVTLGNNYVAIIHLWSEVNVGGTWHPLDPSFKEYESSNGLDLGPILGYDRGSFLAAAQSGATVTADYSQNLNAANVRSELASYASNLIIYLDQNSPFVTPAEVVGERKIVHQDLAALPTELPYTLYGASTEMEDISGLMYYPISITLPGAEYVSSTVDTAGERVTIFFEGATVADRAAIEAAGGIYEVEPAYGVKVVPVLRVGGTVVATGSPGMLGDGVPVTVTLTAPWREDGGNLYFQATAEDKFSAGASVALFWRLQQVSSAQVSWHQELLASARSNGLADDTEPVLGGALTVMGLALYHQDGLADALASQMAGVGLIQHFSFGWLYQDVSLDWEEVGGKLLPRRLSLGSPVVDLAYGFDVSLAYDRDPTLEDAYRFATSPLASAKEHGVFEQMQDLPGVSTVQVLHLANAAGDKVFRITAANLESVLAEMRYIDFHKDYFRDLVADGYEIVAPQQHVTHNEWTGFGWTTRAPDGYAEGFMLSGGFLSGGGGTERRLVRIDEFLPDVWRVPLDGLTGDPNSTDPNNPRHVADPVDPATGAILYAHRDLGFGTLGFAVSFSRSYASSGNRVVGPLGPGWTHSYAMRLVESSEWTRLLGGGTAADAAAAIAYMHVATDMARMEATDLPWQYIPIGCEMAHWLMSQLTDNAVLITDHRGSPHSYLLLPNGSYRPGQATYSGLASDAGGGYTLEGKDGSQLSFDVYGRLTSLSDADDNRTVLTYDSAGHLVRVTDPVGRRINLSYSGDLLSLMTDPVGQQIRYAYDSHGRLVSYTDSAGHAESYSYGQQDRLSSIRDPEGHFFVACEYDSQGRVVTQTNGVGGVVTLGYGGDRTVVTNPDGGGSTYHYDEQMRLVKVEDPLGHEQATTYDGNGNTVSTTDERGQTTRYTYDARGNLTRVTDALGQAAAYTYSAQDNLTRVTDPLGHSWRYEYDVEHHLLRATDPLGNYSRYEYDARGQMTSVTDANGRTASLVYDGSGNLTRVTTALGQITEMEYDSLGQLTPSAI